MQTILDRSKTWFLQSLTYSDRQLEVVVTEGLLSEMAEDLVLLGKNYGPSHRIEVRDESRRVRIRFSEVCTYQVYYESYGHADGEYETEDRGFLRAPARSVYLDFFRSFYPLFNLPGPDLNEIRPYRLWTENEIIEVVSRCEPSLAEINAWGDPIRDES